MRFAIFAATAAAAFMTGVSASTYGNGTTVYTTEVVTAYTTYCPAATSIVHGNQTYTVTEVCAPLVPLRATISTLVDIFFKLPQTRNFHTTHTEDKTKADPPIEQPTTLTITNCPCTLTKPVLTSTIISCTGCASTSTAAAVPTTSSIPAAGPVYGNSSTAAPSGLLPTTTAGSTATASPFPGAANKAVVRSGALVAGFLGLAVYLL
ncbi:hypothetical protein MMC19_000067 [Ptychographa xylographoides]|nr:hypothetical protein [Ptychographa xylographoides]